MNLSVVETRHLIKIAKFVLYRNFCAQPHPLSTETLMQHLKEVHHIIYIQCLREQFYVTRCALFSVYFILMAVLQKQVQRCTV